MPKAFYILTPVEQLYKMYNEAKEREYPLFEANIREYLGRNAINKGIIETLKHPQDRSNFFYYNNGVTIVCNNVKTAANSNQIEVIKPQIVNGCQTVNSINEVLSTYTHEDITKEFSGTFVMVKILQVVETKQSFYRDVVKYTNKQNSINENVFGGKTDLFVRVQKEFKERGFLLLIKPSDKNTFSSEYCTKEKLNELLKLANGFSKR
ncbi:AIPR family protein [Nemorincola caseinilytica]